MNFKIFIVALMALALSACNQQNKEYDAHGHHHKKEAEHHDAQEGETHEDIDGHEHSEGD